MRADCLGSSSCSTVVSVVYSSSVDILRTNHAHRRGTPFLKSAIGRNVDRTPCDNPYHYTTATPQVDIMAPQVKKAKTAFLYYQAEQLSVIRKELNLGMGDAMTEVRVVRPCAFVG